MQLRYFEVKQTPIYLNKLNVLVGPNNVGKSTILADIKNYMVLGPNSSNRIIIDRLSYDLPPYSLLCEGIITNLSEYSKDVLEYKGIKFNLIESDLARISKGFKAEYEEKYRQESYSNSFSSEITKLKVAHLDAASRLAIATKANFIEENHQASNLLQLLYENEQADLELNQIFESAFGMKISLDYSTSSLFFRVAKNFEGVTRDRRGAYQLLDAFAKLDDQGDGYRSLIGVALSIILCRNRIILLDEPDAFLHPAQARILGRWIAQMSNKIDGQLLIATHNSNFLSGILSADANVNIYRLNRSGNKTSFHHIKPENVSKLMNSPLLSSQPVLDSIFHKLVVVCEGGTDRAVYQAVASKKFDDQNAIFIHAYNKQTIKDIVRLIKDVSIDVRAIVDIDILNSKYDLRNLMNSFTDDGDEEILRIRGELEAAINQETDTTLLSQLQSDLQTLISELPSGNLSISESRSRLNKCQRSLNKWRTVKERGLEGVPQELRESVKKIIVDLKSLGLFIIPVGELEGWMEFGISRDRKDAWVIKMMTELSNNNCPANLEFFINGVLGIYFQELTDIITYCLQNPGADFEIKRDRVKEIGKVINSYDEAQGLENMFRSLKSRIGDSLDRDINQYRSWWNDITEAWEY